MFQDEVYSTEVYDRIKAGRGYSIIKVESAVLDDIEYGVLKLKKDTSYDLYRNLRIAGEVVDADSRNRSSVLFEDSPGFPLPINRGIARYITADVMESGVRAGDTAYFNYLTLRPHNYLGKDTDGYELYKCENDQIFCVVRDGEIRMLNGWILVRPFYKGDLEDIEIDELDVMGRKTGRKKVVKGRMSKGGIITDLQDRPVFRHGIVEYIGDNIPGFDFGVKKGDKVIYENNVEFKNTIEGKEYFVMKQWNVVASYIGERLECRGWFAHIAPEPKRSMLVWVPDDNRVDNTYPTGRVLSAGPLLKEVSAGQRVMYNEPESRIVRLEGRRSLFLPGKNIFAVFP